MSFKLKNLLAKRMTVAEGVRLPVSRHFYYSTFGVRGRYENAMKTGNYICSGTPGTGFFSRGSDSHSYRNFVINERKKTDQSFLTLLLRKEPNFDKEIKKIDEVFDKYTDDESRRILSCYQNVLALAKEEELLQRVVRAIKDKMGGHPNKMLVSILSHYKSSIATLEHDVKATQINIANEISETELAAWQKVMEAFIVLEQSRRLWSVYTENGVQSYEQVFFDTGIFDYIQSPFDTAVMRDHNDVHYYLYPNGLIEGRTSTDFDFYRWSDIGIHFSVVDISALAVRPQFNSRHGSSKHQHNDALSNLYGATRSQVVGEIVFEFGGKTLRFFVNHTGPADDFVKAVGAFLQAKNEN